jgi:predicted SAM-dependent methyltransferase
LSSAKRWAAELHPEARSFRRVRWRLAKRHLRGEGLEIGALHKPLALPRGARARYVDRLDVPGLREHYPELAALPLVPVDLIDDGETLSRVPDESVDFVVANHFIEHTQDPIGTLACHLRVLRPGGVLYMAIPDKRQIFDHTRPVTTLEHVVRDHLEGPEGSRRAHYEEWAREVSRVLNNIPDHLVDEEARSLEEHDYSIHFHVWTPVAWLELLAFVARTQPIDVLECVQNQTEFIAVLRKENIDSAQPRAQAHRFARDLAPSA